MGRRYRVIGNPVAPSRARRVLSGNAVSDTGRASRSPTMGRRYRVIGNPVAPSRARRVLSGNAVSDAGRASRSPTVGRRYRATAPVIRWVGCAGQRGRLR